MRIFSKISFLLLLPLMIGLSSCVNEVKTPSKSQPKDTLSQLAIVYSIPDSNNILAVNFHALMTPTWQKNYRVDWDFGDGTGIISKFDTSNLMHYFQKYGSYQVTLSVTDTLTKNMLGNTFFSIEIDGNAIDTNFLHNFTKADISFIAPSENLDFSTGKIASSMLEIFYHGNNPPLRPTIHWNNRNMQIFGYYDTSYAVYNTQYGYQTASISWGSGFSFGCYISNAGYMIDSGSYQSGYNEHDITQHTWVFKNSIKSIKYQSINRISFSKDSIVFLCSGRDLQQKVSQVLDSSNEIVTTMLPPPTHGSGYHLVNILWDQEPSPILRIKLYK